MRRLSYPHVILLALAVTNCRGCTEKAPEHVLGLVDPGAAGVLLVPDLTRASRGAEGFFSRVTRKGGSLIAKGFRGNIALQLGMDPLDSEAWPKVGIDPASGIVLFTEGASPEGVLAARLLERGTFETAFLGMIKRVDGASQRAVETVPGGKLHTVGRPFGDQTVPVVHWAYLGPYVLASRATGRASLVAALERLSPGGGKSPATLHDDAGYKTLQGKIPPGEAVFLLRGEASKLLGAQGAPVIADSITSLRVSGQGISSDTFIGIASTELAAVLNTPPVMPLANNIDGDAVAVLLTRAAKSEAVAALRGLKGFSSAFDETVAPIAETTGINAERDALPLFAGPMTVALHLNDLDSLPDRVRSRNMAKILEIVHASATAELKDRAGMIAVLERSAAALTGRGVPTRHRTIKVGDTEAMVWEPDVAQPRLSWGVFGDTYIYGAGVGRFEKTLKTLTNGKSDLPSQLDTTVGGNLAKEKGHTVAVVRVGQLVELAKGAKFGGAMSGLVSTVTQMLGTLGDVGISLSAEAGGLRLKLREQIQ